MGTIRFLPFHLSAVILASLGCARDSTPSKPDVPGAKKEAPASPASVGLRPLGDAHGAKKEVPDSKVKHPQSPEKKVKFTEALTQSLIAKITAERETMTEANITEILGTPPIMDKAQITRILKANPDWQIRLGPGEIPMLLDPQGIRVVIWEDSVGNLVVLDFPNGKAGAGFTKIYSNR
ncbi:MAG: hypothetical protein Q8M16_23840 [Pirellulaceae bacterium]|nr:hypothetical protein [Pirellulaceae bacterium]